MLSKFLSPVRTLLTKGKDKQAASVSQNNNYGFGVPEDTVLSKWFDHASGALYEGFVVDSDDVVLDVGCGDAPFITFCAEQGADVAFVDVDSSKVEATRKALESSKAKSVTPILSDCNPLPLPNEYASKILSLEVLEHVDNPEVVLAELYRVGKPGALYLITVPGEKIEKLQKAGLAPDVYFEKPNHIRVFDDGDLKALVEDAGLVVESQSQFGFYWSMWWVFFWACRQDLSPPWHPLLQSWTTTWQELLKTSDGPRIKQKMDEFMPKTQLIIARKPK